MKILHMHTRACSNKGGSSFLKCLVRKEEQRDGDVEGISVKFYRQLHFAFLPLLNIEVRYPDGAPMSEVMEELLKKVGESGYTAIAWGEDK